MSRKKKDPQERDINFDRIKKLLAQRQTTANAMSEKIGANKSFIADLFRGRKSTISVNMLKRLARELGCDVGYLVNETSDPRTHKSSRVVLEGTVQADFWMPPNRDHALLEETQCPLIPNYPVDKQKFYRLRLNQNGLGEYESLIVVIPETPIAGDIVLLQRQNGDLLERSIRRVEQTKNGFLLKNIDTKSTSDAIEIPLSLKTAKNIRILGTVASLHYNIGLRSKVVR